MSVKDDILASLNTLYGEGDIIEVRMMQKYGTTSGYYDYEHFDKCADDVAKYDGLTDMQAIYHTVNVVKPELIARAYNRLVDKTKSTTSEGDISRRVFLPIDIDPVRPANTSSTDELHDASIKKAYEVKEWLINQGMPDMLIADSGNGAHVLIRIDQPNTPEVKTLVETVQKAIIKQFNAPEVDSIDIQGFADANRIWKLYGTKTRKGDEVPDLNIRHRRSKILYVPENFETATIGQLEAIANIGKDDKAAAQPANEPNTAQYTGTKFDIVGFMDQHNIEVEQEIKDRDCTRYRLKECPFNPEHKGKDVAIFQFNDGKLGFKCLHNSCADKHWSDVREHFEPGYKEKRQQKQEGRKENNQAGALISIATRSNVTLFHDDTDEPYARVSNKALGNIIMLVKGRDFKRWLKREYYNDTEDAVGNENYQSALDVIEAKACFEGEEFTLHNRVCSQGGAFWFDTGDWRAVRIDSKGWSVEDNLPIMFRRYTHQKTISISQRGLKSGDVKNILNHMNIKKEDEILFLVYLCSLFVPDIPHTILVLHGEKGSTKTTTFKTIKCLIDPSALEIISFPTNSAELIQKLSHHYFAGFDNVSHLSNWQSDALCRAATGEGNSKRALYTNDEDVIYNYRRCVGLNGINNVATMADLLDRSLLINVERVSVGERLTESDYWQKFNNAKEGILAGIFDTVSAAIKIYNAGEIKKENLPRMADFALWGCAIAEALGHTHSEFLTAYNQNIQAQNREALEGSPIGDLVLHLMNALDIWEGTPSELLAQLESIAEENKINLKVKGFPRAPNALTRRLNEIKSNLCDEGITFKTWHSSGRHILLQKIPSSSSSSTKQEQETAKEEVGIEDGILDADRTDLIPTYTKQEHEAQQDDKDDKGGILRTNLIGQIRPYANIWQTSNGPANSSNIDKFVMNFMIDQANTGQQYDKEDVKAAAMKIFKLVPKQEIHTVIATEDTENMLSELQAAV